MVGHHHLRTVGHHQLRLRRALLHNGVDFIDKGRYMQRDAVADNVHRMLVKHTGGQCVQRELPIVVDNGVARVRAALEPNNYI